MNETTTITPCDAGDLVSYEIEIAGLPEPVRGESRVLFVRRTGYPILTNGWELDDRSSWTVLEEGIR